MLHGELFGDCGDIGCLMKTESGANIIVVDLDDKEFVCLADFCKPIFLWEYCLNLNCSFVGRLWILHGDTIDIQKDQNAIMAKVEVGINWRLCEPKRE